MRIKDLLSKIHKSIRFVDNSYHPGRCSELRICSLNLKNFPGQAPRTPPLWGTSFGGPITPPGADEPFHFFLPSDAPGLWRNFLTSVNSLHYDWSNMPLCGCAHHVTKLGVKRTNKSLNVRLQIGTASEPTLTFKCTLYFCSVPRPTNTKERGSSTYIL